MNANWQKDLPPQSSLYVVSGTCLDEIPPNHSILSKATKRFGRGTYEQFFKEIVKLCEEAGLIEGNKVVLDATLLKANASFDSLEERKEACELEVPGRIPGQGLGRKPRGTGKPTTQPK